MVLHKQIGEKASTACPDNAIDPCDIDFAVTSIQPNVPCADEYDPLGPNEQMLRFDVEIWTAPQFDFPDQSVTALFLDNWGVGDAAGVDKDLRDHTAIRCAGQLTGDQISKSVAPGTHMAKSIFVSAPRNATILRLYDGPRGDGWTWDVPPA